MPKKVFIIGNGFDLDLGLNTGYADFAQSNYWPSDNEFNLSQLGQYLNEKKNLCKWLDLELALKEYAQIKKEGLALQTDSNNDKIAFQSLCGGLTYYLNKEQSKTINTESVAAKVLRAVVDNGYFTSIYSYNYTDLYKTAEKLHIQHQFDYKCVHGCLGDNSIILGVTDTADLREGYSFLYKTFSTHYESNSVQYDLQEADEIVIFGHSLGENDYHYFKSFFQRQCDETMERKQSKRITIFTYNDASHISIMEQLHRMNEKKTNLLFGLNELQFIYTAPNESTSKLNRFLKHLKEDSMEAEEDRMEKLASMLP